MALDFSTWDALFPPERGPGPAPLPPTGAAIRLVIEVKEKESEWVAVVRDEGTGKDIAREEGRSPQMAAAKAWEELARRVREALADG